MADLARKMQQYRASWNLDAMRGDRHCLKWNLQDLAALDVAIKASSGRSVVVQAGGNLGIFAKRLAEEFEVVYTFEPDEDLLSCLRHNAPEPNIRAIRAALGKSTEPIALDCKRRDSSGRPAHAGMTFVAGPGSIPQMRIDDLALDACDLIYLDIEGYELYALQGAELTVTKFRPTIAVESNGNMLHYGIERGAVRVWLADRGYKLLARLHGDDIYTWSYDEDQGSV